MKSTLLVIDIFIAAFSVAAAYYWFMSARVPVPAYPEGHTSPNAKNAHAFRLIEQISTALKTQSKLSAKAASFAAIAAVFTVFSVILHNLPTQ